MLDIFEDFEIHDSPDPAYDAMVLVCPHCNGHVCDVEHGDSLGTLTRCAADHAASCVFAAGGLTDDLDTCAHLWLDRPESDTRECEVCGTQVAG